MISVTFDDGWTSQYDNALPILNRYSVPATMYIYTEAINQAPSYMTQAQIQAFASRGDEIASHTVTHPHLITLTADQVNNELSQSKATLQGMFGPSAAIDFASPFGESNPTTTAAVKSFYSSQRNTEPGFNAAAGFDPYNIFVQNVDSTTTATTVQGWINDAKTNGTWLVLVYHEVGASLGADIYHTDTTMLDAHMAAVKNSGLPMVTVRKGVEAMTSPATTPPPTTPPPTTPPPTTPPPTTQQYPLYKILYDSTIYELKPDSAGNQVPVPLSYENWRDVYNFRTPTPASTDFVKYPWSPTVYAVTFWPGGENSWMWTRLSFAQWQTAGYPAPRNAGWIKGSYYYKWGTTSELFVQGEDGVNHKLTGDEWAASGYRAYDDRGNEGFMKVTWAPEVARMSNLSTGAGRPMGYSEWQQEAFPTPLAVQRITGDQFYKDCASTTIWYAGPGMNRPVSLQEWQGAGSPGPTILGTCG